MAALPLASSASGVNGPKASRLAFLKIGIMEAAEKTMNVPMMLIGASLNWAKTDSPVESSAPKAATKASMARRPLINSGAPENAITSPNPGAFGSGIRVEAAAAGGVVVCTNTYSSVTVTATCGSQCLGTMCGQNEEKTHTSSATAADSAFGADSGSSGEAAYTLTREARETLFN
jgi:hypothetical protein